MYRLLRIRPPRSDVALAVVLSLLAIWWSLRFAHDQSDQPTRIDLHLPRPDRPLPPDLPLPSDGAAESSGDSLRGLLLNLVITLAVAVRREWPLAVVLAQFGAILAFDNGADLVTLAATLIGAYSLCLYGRSTALSFAVLLVVSTVVALRFDNTNPELPGWAGVFALIVPIALLGVTIRAARTRALAADQRAEALQHGQEAATRLAVAEERARIARELHDVVSHHVSVMTIQAGAAGKVIDAQPDLARDALAAIEASGRETMTELRHLLGVLAPGPTDDLLHPQPGLDQLDTLVDNVRRAGQPVTVRCAVTDLPRGTDLTAYRVVQEALTNALRHAPGAPTDITVEVVADELRIEVTNDAAPAGGAGTTPEGTGAGLMGLAERLRLYGGTLRTGPRPTGGFRLQVRIPLAEHGPLEAP